MNYLEPWPEPVDGAEVLYSIEATLRRYVSMPDGSPELVALWVMFTWAIDASDIAPRPVGSDPSRTQDPQSIVSECRLTGHRRCVLRRHPGPDRGWNREDA
jgi:hypothetical protein